MLPSSLFEISLVDPLQAIEMAASAAASAGREDVFEVGTSLRIYNSALNVDVTIHSPFIKELQGDSRFVSLDFYQSRGVYSLLSSRLPKKPQAKRPYAKVLAKVVGKLKRKRDDAFRAESASNADADPKLLKYRGPHSVRPLNRDRGLKAVVMAQSDVVQCDMPPLDGESDGFRLSCMVPLDRHNKNNEMFVDASSSTLDFLSKLVAQEYRASQASQEGSPTTVAPEEATAVPVVADPAPVVADPTLVVAESGQSPSAAQNDEASCTEWSDGNSM